MTKPGIREVGMAILSSFRRAWNAFRNATPHSVEQPMPAGGTSYYMGASPSRSPVRHPHERSIISSIYTKLSIDFAGIHIRHVQLDDEKRYIDDVDSPLNSCLTLEPNLDQGPRAFRQDIAMTLFDKGVAAIVPVDTSEEPNDMGKYDIYNVRVGEVVSWHPQHVRLRVYNEEKGEREEVLLKKRNVAIIENPLYSVMNEPNSTLQRLIRKLSLLDAVDEQSSSGKLDVIIQLPYVIKSEHKRNQAETRREDIEMQLRGSKYGIAYIDGTEKITQLNRPAENNLLQQVEYLTNLLYSQLGLTEEVMNGTADEGAMVSYFTRTIEPILDAVVEAMQRSFLGAAAVSGKQRIMYFRDVFKFVPLKDIAEIADKFTRNEILTSNEIRSRMGIPPSDDPKADQLINSNMPQPDRVPAAEPLEGEQRQNGRV